MEWDPLDFIRAAAFTPGGPDDLGFATRQLDFLRRSLAEAGTPAANYSDYQIGQLRTGIGALEDWLSGTATFSTYGGEADYFASAAMSGGTPALQAMFQAAAPVTAGVVGAAQQMDGKGLLLLVGLGAMLLRTEGGK